MDTADIPSQYPEGLTADRPSRYPEGLTAEKYWRQQALLLLVRDPDLAHSIRLERWRSGTSPHTKRVIELVGNPYQHMPSTIILSVKKALVDIHRETKKRF